LGLYDIDNSYLTDRLKDGLSSNINPICWVVFTAVAAFAYVNQEVLSIALGNLLLITKINFSQYTVGVQGSFQTLIENFTNYLHPLISSWTAETQCYLVGFQGQIHNLGEKLLVVPLGISVIVPTLNEEKYITRCLRSLVKQTYQGRYEVIVVDGGSTDKTVELAEDLADRVLVRPGPAGFARNEGARTASDDIYAFLDADTMASTQWLENMEESFNSNCYVSCVTGPTYPYEGNRWDHVAYVIVTQWLSRISARVGLPHVPGFNCAYRKTPFWKVGGFDEKRRLSEDIILSTKIRKEGQVRFNKDMVAYTSLRRIKKHGYPYLTTFYVINGLIALTAKGTMPTYNVVR
jgi:hypothetical protein